MHEPAVDGVQKSFVRFIEAEGDFRITEAVLLGRLSWKSVAATTAQVFGKLLAYLAAKRDFYHADALFKQEAYLGKTRTGATTEVIVETLHRTIDRLLFVEEELRIDEIIYRVLLLVEGTGAETTA